MAVAAYASVINLMQVLDQVQHPVRRRLLPNTKQIETLQEKVHFLQEFLEDQSPTKIEGIEDLAKQITEVANEAEDIINSHVVDQLHQEYEDKTEMNNFGGSESTTHEIDFHVGLSNTTDRPERCKRTDGKKWRCSRDAVVDKKYCKRHLNRGGRNDSLQSPHSTNNTNLPPIASSMSASVVGGGGGVSTNIINRSLVDKEIPKDKHTYSVPEQKPTVSVRAGSSTVLPSRGKSTHVVMEFSSSSFCQYIDKLIEKIDSIKEKLLLTMVKAKEKAVQEQQPVPIVSVRAGSSTLLPSPGKSSTHVVGFDDHLVEIKKLLTRDQPNLQIIPIVGMGGIGKTTLARFVFEDKYVVEKFDKRVWFTISQEYSVHEIIMGVLRDIGVLGDIKNKTLAELRLRLYQELSGRRYLIVMDDLWSTNGWDDFKLSFPNYRNGSRVMVTTRLNDVAVSLGSQNTYTMNFLDEDNSWNLLCEKAFTQGSCSPELEEIGKRIAKSCKGLPLAIVVIGGLLAKSNMTQEYWAFVAGKVNLLVSSKNDEDCSKILLLSYNHLPIHLKPCFLYIRFYPEDYAIKVSDLTKSWVVEGFLKPIRGKSLEEVANEYLKDLIERNLMLVRERGDFGDIESCGVHDLLRDLCRRESLKEHFFSVPKSQEVDFSLYGENEKPMCFLYRAKSNAFLLPSPVNGLADDPKCYHHLLVKFDGYYTELPLYTKLGLLSLLNYKIWPSVLLSPISQLWNLHTLYIETSSFTEVINLPFEIWEMPQLRHVNVKARRGGYLPIVTENDRKDFIVLENLHTLVTIDEFRCTEDVVKRIPNMKELKIEYKYCSREKDWSYYCLHNIANLHKLESLLIASCRSTFAFPYSLKKLELLWCRIPWEDMTVIGSLPNLEILLLHDAEAMERSSLTHEWTNPVEGGFRQLRFLKISGINLKRWRAESVHFPKLEILKLVEMDKLEEIPSGIGEIETLRKIELRDCSSSVINSAKEIYEEQKSFGNEDFQLFINFERYEN